MEPLYFGESSSPLYGVYHAPNTKVYSERAVLLCYPGGHEYMRIHRAYRQLASQLNKIGCHTFRFDYFGEGDSAGNHHEIKMERWVADVHSAVKELQALSNVRYVDIIGLRLGALVAAEVASELKHIKRLVLWEPMLSGQQFIDEMKDHIVKSGVSKSNFIDNQHSLNLNGYCFSKESLQTIAGLRMDDFEWKNKPKVLSLTAREELIQPINKHFESKITNHKMLFVPGLTDWNALDADGGLFLPMDSVNAICGWIETN
jgi:alpha/beta superfamily hydrolase